MVIARFKIQGTGKKISRETLFDLWKPEVCLLYVKKEQRECHLQFF